jgi:glycine oxidase
VPRSDGRVVIGATMEEKGWDLHPTAGAVHDLLRYAYELVPGITEMRFGSVRVGFRPGTPDNAPLLGPTSLEGLILATGHFRNGILLTPITADLITELLVSGSVPGEMVPFSPERHMVRAS